VSERMDEQGMEGVLSDVKQFARRRPGVFLAASLVGGLVAGRMLRSGDMSEFVDTMKQSVSGSGENSDGQGQQPSAPTGISGQTQPQPSLAGAVTPAAPASGYPLPSDR